MRVVTYNVKAATGPFPPNRVLAELKRHMHPNMFSKLLSGKNGTLRDISVLIRRFDPDIAALQEVDPGSLRSANQVPTLSKGYFPIFQPLKGGFFASQGNLLLTKEPAYMTEFIGFRTSDEPRGIIHSQVGGVDIYATHLTPFPKYFTSQMMQLERVVNERTGPAVLLGDLNPQFGENLADFTAKTGLRAARTGPTSESWNPHQTLDYVLYSEEFVCRGAHVIESRLSDHYPVVADLSFRSAPQK